MEIRVLQYFLVVAREQSITAAAHSLHLSQPTLSRQLHDLEEELGKPLFERGSRKITLTEEGMILKKRAEEILELVKKAENEITLDDTDLPGDIYIGAGETDAFRILSRAMYRLHQDFPLIRFHIISGDQCTVADQLDNGLIDFGLVFGNPDRTKYEVLQTFHYDRWGVLMRRSDPLAAKEVLSPADLKNLPLIVSRQEFCAETFQRTMPLENGEIHIVSTYNLLLNASIMVEEGVGYALCIEHLINTTGNSALCFRPIQPTLQTPIHIIWKKYQLLSKPAEKFVLQLKEILNAPDVQTVASSKNS